MAAHGAEKALIVTARLGAKWHAPGHRAAGATRATNRRPLRQRTSPSPGFLER